MEGRLDLPLRKRQVDWNQRHQTIG